MYTSPSILNSLSPETEWTESLRLVRNVAFICSLSFLLLWFKACEASTYSPFLSNTRPNSLAESSITSWPFWALIVSTSSSGPCNVAWCLVIPPNNSLPSLMLLAALTSWPVALGASLVQKSRTSSLCFWPTSIFLIICCVIFSLFGSFFHGSFCS